MVAPRHVCTHLVDRLARHHHTFSKRFRVYQGYESYNGQRRMVRIS